MLHRFVPIVMAVLTAGQALALDCGGEAKPCEITAGEYHIALPEGWQGGPAVMHLHGFGGSGGKVIREIVELSGDVEVLIAANPCFGLDFAAVAQIHAEIMAARNRGAAVLLVSEDLDAAYAIHRKTLTGYVSLPNYRNYWRVAGYDKEMDNIESIISSTPKESLAEQLQQAMTDEWLRDCTISGNASQVREQFAAWANAGVLPIAVMSSTSGGQAKAVAELFATYES